MSDWDKDYRSASMIGRNPEIVRDAANAEIERLKAAEKATAEVAANFADEIERLKAALKKIYLTSDEGRYGCSEVMRSIALDAIDGKPIDG